MSQLFARKEAGAQSPNHHHGMRKKLVVFCDGTWNTADQHTHDGRPCPTNVLRLFECTCHEDGHGHPQIAHYVAGVGTRRGERMSGGAFGMGIDGHIKNAYSFTVSNYEPGDEIYLFGFSRGAFTARSLAGFIRNSGILKRHYLHRIDEAYGLYKNRSDDTHPESAAAQQFRKAYSHDNETIHFLGVWDTVGALGVPYGFVMGWIAAHVFKFGFHDTQVSRSVLSAYHAMAIDEHRWPFRPTPMTFSDEHRRRNEESKNKNGILLYEEKWFPGAHSNVGGGYPSPVSCLADCGLQWMAEKATARGLRIDLEKISIPPYKPDVSLPPSNSQTLGYRLATILFVRLPRFVWRLLLPKEQASQLSFVTLGGDYLRPIENLGNWAPAVQRYPDAKDYAGGLSEAAIAKLATDKSYHPRNIA